MAGEIAEAPGLAAVPMDLVASPVSQVSEDGQVGHRRPSVKLSEPHLPHLRQGPVPTLVEEIMTDYKRSQAQSSQGLWSLRRKALAQFVDSAFFEYLTGAIILVNIVTIGIEADMSLKGFQQAAWSVYVEQAFLAIYSVELIVRFVAGGCGLLTSCWFLMDLFLVCVGVIAVVVAPVVTGGGSEMDGFQKLLVVRGLRLLRLARVLRVVGRFKVVWRLVSGLLTAWETMLSASILIGLCLFIFACTSPHEAKLGIFKLRYSR